MLLIITGNGKGKTTSAIGQTIRALGQGKKVFFLQFIKGDVYPAGEDSMMRSLAGVTFIKSGKGFVGILGDKLPRSEHRKAAEKGLALAVKAAKSGKYGLLVLDEVNVALGLKLLSLAAVKKFLASVKKDADVMLTGRGAHPWFIKKADLVTECAEIKHPYQKKVAARKGVEY